MSPPTQPLQHYDEFKAALKESLASRGVLNKLQASIRQEIFAVLDEDDPATAAETRAGAGGEGSGSSFNGNLLINELIRDYLKFNGLRHSLAVFMAETGQPKTPMTRNELKRELHIETPPLTTTSSSATTELPLLYPLALRNIAHMHQDRIVPPPIHPSSGSTTTTEEKLHHQEEEMLRF